MNPTKSDGLAIYLNDHLAGSVGTIEMIELAMMKQCIAGESWAGDAPPKQTSICRQSPSLRSSNFEATNAAKKRCRAASNI